MHVIVLLNDENVLIKHDDDGCGGNSILARRTKELAGALPDQVLAWH
jgi:hypothetical protein